MQSARETRGFHVAYSAHCAHIARTSTLGKELGTFTQDYKFDTKANTFLTHAHMVIHIDSFKNTTEQKDATVTK